METAVKIVPEAYFDLLVRIVPGMILILMYYDFDHTRLVWTHLVYSYILGFAVSLLVENLYIWFKWKENDFDWFYRDAPGASRGSFGAGDEEKRAVLNVGDLWRPIWIKDDSFRRVDLGDFPVLKKMLAELYLFRVLRFIAPIAVFGVKIDSIGLGMKGYVMLALFSVLTLWMSKRSYLIVKSLSDRLKSFKMAFAWLSMFSLMRVFEVLNFPVTSYTASILLNFSSGFVGSVAVYSFTSLFYRSIENHILDKASSLRIYCS